MALFNTTGIIGTVLEAFSSNVSGSLFLTLLVIFILLFILAMVFRIPLEFTLIIMLPAALVMMALEGQFIAMGGLILIFLAVILAKNFWFGR